MEKTRTPDEVLLEIEGDAAKVVGLKIGGIVDAYLKALKKYSSEVADRFLEVVFKYLGRLDGTVTGTLNFGGSSYRSSGTGTRSTYLSHYSQAS
ncbi:MAG: hypothetical protein FGF48_01880 [Candidatus Brockarchaeota archaeon]|nr:hypothetical protein [Candidatus Brockarchaeota archaeon]